VPLVFTHHTLYEENVHYVPGNEEALKRFVIELSTGYANLADKVFAPSESVMELMQAHGVQSSIEVVPTGIDVKKFIHGDGQAVRKQHNIPADAFVVGHVGRLAPEKNLEFLAWAVANFLKSQPAAHFLVVGKGPSEEVIQQIILQEGLQDRFHMAGVLKGDDLINAYHAMDVFVFASQSETQGLVLTEAMAAGIPVVAVDAPGVREVVKEELVPFRKELDEFKQEVRSEFHASEQRVTVNILSAVKEMFDDFRHEMNTNFDAVMGRLNKYDEEHEILREQHRRVLDHEERIEKLKAQHPHPHIAS
jgi:glycosyltransferase involved in cell wall biosynthesis